MHKACPPPASPPIDHVQRVAATPAAASVSTAVACQLFTKREVLDATSNFTSRILGEGTFGRVYLGQLAGMHVAVKVVKMATYSGGSIAAYNAAWEEIKAIG